jgi:hypothetical protein
MDIKKVRVCIVFVCVRRMESRRKRKNCTVCLFVFLLASNPSMTEHVRHAQGSGGMSKSSGVELPPTVS